MYINPYLAGGAFCSIIWDSFCWVGFDLMQLMVCVKRSYEQKKAMPVKASPLWFMK
jgi:hypothetical protein